MAKVMEKEKTKTIDVQAMIDDLAEKANAALKEMTISCMKWQWQLWINICH